MLVTFKMNSSYQEIQSTFHFKIICVIIKKKKKLYEQTFDIPYSYFLTLFS